MTPFCTNTNTELFTFITIIIEKKISKQEKILSDFVVSENKALSLSLFLKIIFEQQ